jgi:hypothetical protein
VSYRFRPLYTETLREDALGRNWIGDCESPSADMEMMAEIKMCFPMLEIEPRSSSLTVIICSMNNNRCRFL